jgi:hypothetical protein
VARKVVTLAILGWAMATVALVWENHRLSRQVERLVERGQTLPSTTPPAPLVIPIPSAAWAPPAAAPTAGAVADASRVAAEAAPEIRAEALARASRVVDEVLARHRLTYDDVAALRRELKDADPEAANALRRRIIVAINKDELVPEGPGYTF